MRFIIRPLHDPDSTLDMTEAIIDAVARQLSVACGGNAVLNRLEAAAHVDSLLRRAAALPEGERIPRASSAHHFVEPVEEEFHAVVDSGEADRERQPQGYVVQRLSLERAG